MIRSFRVTAAEDAHLRKVAQERDVFFSDLIREALQQAGLLPSVESSTQV